MGVCLPGGERRWLRVNAEPLRTADGKVSGVVSCFQDITRYVEQRKLLQTTIAAAELGLWQWDLRTGEQRCNDVWWRLLGHESGPHEVTQQLWASLVHPEDLPHAQQAVQHHLEDPSQPYRSEFRMRRAGGGWVWILSAGAAIERANDGRVLRMAGVHIDISQRKALELRLGEAALTDELTQLPNRAALRSRLHQCCARAQRDTGYRYALLFLDLDRFKTVNDSLGHEAGDELLRQIGERLRSVLRLGDDIARPGAGADLAARLGGDEFVVLLEPLQHPDDALGVARRLIDALARPFSLRGREVHSGASIGIVIADAGRDCDPEAVLRDADIAMYEAKRRGRGRVVVFEHHMHQRVHRALDLEADLRQALQSGDELFPVYQPIVDLCTGRVYGAEALVRWRHPSRGLIPALDFVALAEESGLIDELGQRMLDAACRDAVAWQQRLGDRAPVAVSVNLSAAQLRNADLTDRVVEALERTGLAPHRLRLEITESIAMQEAQALPALRALRGLGVHIVLDDFGTGYSSLSLLDRLPLSAVKIDRTFVDRLVGNRYRTALIEATLKVAAALDLEVVAEGVETEEQAQLLRDCGCPFAQGWLFGKPATANEFARQLGQATTAAGTALAPG